MFTNITETSTGQDCTTVSPPSFDGYFKWNQNHWECLVGVDYLGMISSNKDHVVFVPPTHPSNSGQYWDFEKSVWLNSSERQQNIKNETFALDGDLELTYTNGILTRESVGLLRLSLPNQTVLTNLSQKFNSFFKTVNIRDLTTFGYNEAKNIVTMYATNLPETDSRLVDYRQQLNKTTLTDFIGYKFDLTSDTTFVKVFDYDVSTYTGPVLPMGSIPIVYGINVGEQTDSDISEIYFNIHNLPSLITWCAENNITYSEEAVNNSYKWMTQRYSIKYNKTTNQITEFKQYLFNSFYTVNSFTTQVMNNGTIGEYLPALQEFEQFASSLGI